MQDLEPLSNNPRALLEWYLEAGVDEVVADAPVDWYAAAQVQAQAQAQARDQRRADAEREAQAFLEKSQAERRQRQPAPSQPPPPSDDAALRTAVQAAAAAETVEALRAALESFDGCGLKKMAKNLVFLDGNPNADVMLVGEGPGSEEDRQGLPFVGVSGQLLDKMLASIDLDRSRVVISNTVFWRPPGNRTPSTSEVAVCMPFLERLIELVDPKVLITLGGPAAKALLGRNESVSRMRGRWFDFATARMTSPIAATVLYHPAYLLRTPAQKRAVWRDLLAIRAKLDAL